MLRPQCIIRALSATDMKRKRTTRTLGLAGCGEGNLVPGCEEGERVWQTLQGVQRGSKQSLWCLQDLH